MTLEGESSSSFGGRQKDSGKGEQIPATTANYDLQLIPLGLRSLLSLHFMVGTGSVAWRVSHISRRTKSQAIAEGK